MLIEKIMRGGSGCCSQLTGSRDELMDGLSRIELSHVRHTSEMSADPRAAC